MTKTWDEIVEIAHEAYCLAKIEGARGDGAMRAALRALIAEGLAIVPREATPSMVEAWRRSFFGDTATHRQSLSAALSAGEIAPKKGEG